MLSIFFISLINEPFSWVTNVDCAIHTFLLMYWDISANPPLPDQSEQLLPIRKLLRCAYGRGGREPNQHINLSLDTFRGDPTCEPSTACVLLVWSFAYMNHAWTACDLYIYIFSQSNIWMPKQSMIYADQPTEAVADGTGHAMAGVHE